jgi:hypothetical protein
MIVIDDHDHNRTGEMCRESLLGFSDVWCFCAYLLPSVRGLVNFLSIRTSRHFDTQGKHYFWRIHLKRVRWKHKWPEPYIVRWILDPTGLRIALVVVLRRSRYRR